MARGDSEAFRLTSTVRCGQKESGMSDQDLATQVEQLRAHQEQTDRSLVALAGAIEDLIEQVEGNPLSGTSSSMALIEASRAVEAVKRNHQSNRGR
jgi:hypothetical protein